MKALSIKQPWLHAILEEGKDIENRNWQTKHRGWIALHAPAKADKHAAFPPRVKMPDGKTLDYSAICGVARLKEIVTKSRSKWFQGEFGWVLTDVHALEDPIPCPGALGLWKVPAPVLARLRKMLPRDVFES